MKKFRSRIEKKGEAGRGGSTERRSILNTLITSNSDQSRATGYNVYEIEQKQDFINQLSERTAT